MGKEGIQSPRQEKRRRQSETTKTQAEVRAGKALPLQVSNTQVVSLPCERPFSRSVDLIEAGVARGRPRGREGTGCEIMSIESV